MLCSDIFEDNSAVSPVIGVILMVAVAVILAAVIGSTALGITEKIGDSPPQVNFETAQSNVSIIDGDPGRTEPYTALTLTHTGGENINKKDISVEVNGKPAYATLLPAENFYSNAITLSSRNDPINPWDSIENETISAGDKTNIILATDTLNNNDVTLGEDDVSFNHDGDTLIQSAFGSYELGTDSGARLSSGDVVRVVWDSGDRTYPLLEEEIS